MIIIWRIKTNQLFLRNLKIQKRNKKKKRSEDLDRLPEKGTIFVDVTKHIYLIQLYTHMLKTNMEEFFRLEVMLKGKFKKMKKTIKKKVLYPIWRITSKNSNNI